MTLSIVAYTAGAVACGTAVALDFRHHRDGLPLASVVWCVVASAVLWPLVAAVAIAGSVARGRR